MGVVHCIVLTKHGILLPSGTGPSGSRMGIPKRETESGSDEVVRKNASNRLASASLVVFY